MDNLDQDVIKKVMSELGKRSASKLTQKERIERGKKAVNARWEKYRQDKAKLSTEDLTGTDR